MFTPRRIIMVGGAIAALIALVIITRCALAPETPWDKPEPGRHVDLTRLFSIKFPEGWNISFRGEGWVVVAARPGGPEHIAVGFEGRSMGKRMEVYMAAQFVAPPAARFAKYTAVKSGERELAGAKAAWAILTFDSGDTTFRMLIYSLNKSGPAMVLACVAPEDSFERYRPQFEKVVESFRVQ
jgi:hypothetical protein